MHELYLLSISAASLGFIHTLLGPDHYLPFIVLSKARHWSRSKTMWITFISGIGHVGSSILIGIFGMVLGISLTRLQHIEAFRGEIAGWMLFTFGIFYTLYGIWKYLRSTHHSHLPAFLVPKKIRGLQHLPTGEQKEDNNRLTPWILFLIFVFGPCEVLIPLFMYTAYQQSALGTFAVALLFSIATIATMMFTVYLGQHGTALLKFKKLERYMHLLAGLVLLISGGGILFWGW